MRRTLTLIVAPCIIFGFFSFTNAQTASELQAQLNALLQQLTALQAQLQTQTGGTSVPTGSASSSYGQCPSLSRTLRQGMTGSDVTALQAFLAADSRIYPEGIISGYFGSLTEAAVRRFQERHAIVSSGTPDTTGYGLVGPQTRSTVVSVCGGGSPQTQLPPYTGSNCSFAGGQVASGVVQTFYSIQIAPTGSTCTSYAQSRQCINGTLSGDPIYQYGSCAEASSLACTVNGTTIGHGTAQTFYSRQSVGSSESCNAYSQVRTCTNGSLSGNSNYQYASCSTQAPSSCTLDGVTVSHGSSRTFYKQSFATSTASCSSYGQTRTCTNGSLSGNSEYAYASCTSGACAIDGITLASGSSTTFYLAQHIPATEQCTSYAQSRSCSSGTLSGNAAYKYSSCAPVSGGACALDNTVLSNGSSAAFYSVGTAPVGKSCAEYDQTRTCTNGSLSGSTSYNRVSCTDTASCTLGGITVTHGESFTFYNASTVPYGSTCSSGAQVRFCVNGVLSGNSTYQYASCSVNPPTSLGPNTAQLAAALAALESILKAALVQLDLLF